MCAADTAAVTAELSFCHPTDTAGGWASASHHAPAGASASPPVSGYQQSAAALLRQQRNMCQCLTHVSCSWLGVHQLLLATSSRRCHPLGCLLAHTQTTLACCMLCAPCPTVLRLLTPSARTIPLSTNPQALPIPNCKCPWQCCSHSSTVYHQQQQQQRQCDRSYVVSPGPADPVQQLLSATQKDCCRIAAVAAVRQ